jgi:hypothetical protein
MRVRPFAKSDVLDVVTLRARCFAKSTHGSPTALAAYFAEVFFGNPWYDEMLPSLVCEDTRGHIVGFLGVVPRRMRFDGQPLLVATSTQFMVAPEAPPLVGTRLLRTLFEGPQALSLTDMATPVTRRLWECLGGRTVSTSSLSWLRVLRPFGHLVTHTAGAGAGLGRPVDALVTRLVRAWTAPRVPSRGVRVDATVPDFVGPSSFDRDDALVRAEYDEPSLAWVLDMASRQRSYGDLRMARVVDRRGAGLGGYIVQTRAGRGARVLHLMARPDATGLVLDHLFRDAWNARCTAVSGRLAAPLVPPLVERRCLVYGPDTWVLVHGRDRAMVTAIARDGAGLTRLDGEWWMAF